MDNQRARVAISYTNERHRSFERVHGLVQVAIDHLGGFGRFVKTGQSVLIKPNQTVFYSAEDGVTTDPLIVRSLVRLSREAGASRIIVGEASGDVMSSVKVMEITGVKAAAEREGAEVIDLKECVHRRVAIANPLLLDHAMIPDVLLDTDVIIDAPKAKTHEHEHLSCACKNWVGTQAQQYRELHHDNDETQKAFMDIMSVTRPHLVVADALICGEGDGPIGNTPRWCGCIVASDDPVATDVTVARMMGIDWEKLRFLKAAEHHSLGVRDPGRIDIFGTPVEEVKFKAWIGHQGEFDYMTCNFIVGEDVSMEGTIGHVKAVLDAWVRQGVMNKIMWLKGTPTFLIGRAEDPRFEEHLKEGPYIVIDDAALERYKTDPRVHFVPGHPVTRKALPGVLDGMGMKNAGNAMMKLQQFQGWGMHNLEYGDTLQKAKTLAVPLAAAAAAAAITFAGVRLLSGRHNGT